MLVYVFSTVNGLFWNKEERSELKENVKKKKIMVLITEKPPQFFFQIFPWNNVAGHLPLH